MCYVCVAIYGIIHCNRISWNTFGLGFKGELGGSCVYLSHQKDEGSNALCSQPVLPSFLIGPHLLTRKQVRHPLTKRGARCSWHSFCISDKIQAKLESDSMQRYKGYSYVATSHTKKKTKKNHRQLKYPVAISKQTTYLKAKFPQLLKHRGQGEHQSPILDHTTLWGAVYEAFHVLVLVGPHGTALSASIQAGHLFSLTKIKNMLLSASRFVKNIAQSLRLCMNAQKEDGILIWHQHSIKSLYGLIAHDGRKTGTGLQAEDINIQLRKFPINRALFLQNTRNGETETIQLGNDT